jgi:acetylornithine deacetylase/succinyl-diaminopimelate desuccinylase family protein
MQPDMQIDDALTAALVELIAIPSQYPPNDSRAICAYAERRLRAAGYTVELLSRTPGIDNIVARLGTGRPSLVFNAHVDTVGVGDPALWRTDPFVAKVENGLVYGLGAGNCKGSMAVQLWLAEEIARRGGPQRGEVVFTFVGDEENLGPDGMEFLRESGAIKPDMLILGAQTENQLIVAERGIMWVSLETTGRPAHAGNPAAGDNAILRLLRVLDRLDKVLGPRLAGRVDGPLRSTINLGLIQGGHNTIVVPGSARAEIDRRLLPAESVDQAYEEMRAIVAEAGEPDGTVRIELMRGTNGFTAPPAGQAMQAFEAAILGLTGKAARYLTATGVSDGRWFARAGIEIINFGPGSGAQGHAANESVPIAEMVAAAHIQLDFVNRLLGLAGGPLDGRASNP